MKRLNAAALRTKAVDWRIKNGLKKHPIYLILDNIYDTYNIGAFFRLSDALAVQKIFLCGKSETPPHPAINKASINTWQWVDWEYRKTALSVLKKLRSEIPGIKIIAVEQNQKSISLKNFHAHFPLALIFGNETAGVSKKILEKVDGGVEVPMFGVNKSLNAAVCCGVVLYQILQREKHL